MQRDRNILAHIIKSWAQEHDNSVQIAAPGVDTESIDETAGFFTWVIREKRANIDLLLLLDRLELYVDSVRRRKHPDGMFCRKCQSFYQYAEPNQTDGTLLCYSCRSSPYV